jgi:hypothetical protein
MFKCIKIPKYLLDISEKYNVNIDIMIEAKMKEKQYLNYMKNIRLYLKTMSSNSYGQRNNKRNDYTT